LERLPTQLLITMTEPLRIIFVCVAAAACAALPSAWASPANSANSVSAVLGCLIEAERVADIGSPVVGVVSEVHVDRGDRVSKGQVLAVLRASVERASLSVASSRADSTAEMQAAQTNAKFARDKLDRTEGLFREQFVSEQAVHQARAEADVAEQRLSLVRDQRRVSMQERGVAAAQLSQRVIRSPIDGVVAERFVTAGERVDDKPLLRIAKLDPLRVQLVVPVAMYLQVQTGGVANVWPDLPGAKQLQAKVTMIDKVIDPASNTFRVHLELPNANGELPAGLRCKANFGAPIGAPTVTTGANPAAPAAAPAAATMLRPVKLN
jgi:RND family efflux transporter MFP subunit